jgi:hypothetical protein
MTWSFWSGSTVRQTVSGQTLTGALAKGGQITWRAKPMIGSVQSSSRMRPASAGKICLNARSPVAPKKTKASEATGRDVPAVRNLAICG